MHSCRRFVFLAVTALLLIIPAVSVQAQYSGRDCQTNETIDFGQTFRSSSSWITCLNPYGTYQWSVDITVRSGSINLYFGKESNSAFQWRGNVTSADGPINVTIAPAFGVRDDRPTLMVVPSGGVDYSITVSSVDGSLTADNTQFRPGVAPSQVTRPIRLDYIGDRTMIPVDVCPGELQVIVRGMPERNDIFIHIYPLGGQVPRVGDPPNVNRASNLIDYYFVSWQRITRAQAQANPVWVVYVTRNGYTQNRPLVVEVTIDTYCGYSPIDGARPPRNAFRTRPGSGARLVSGGVSVQNYCNATGDVARTVNDQYWLCFNPYNLTFRTLEPADFDAMCRQQRHSRAYGVKPNPGAGGLECYR